MGQNLPLCGQLGATRSRQDESNEVHDEAGRIRRSSRGKEGHVVSLCPLMLWQSLSLPFGEVEQRMLPPLLGGDRAKGQEGAGARASGPSGGDGVGWTRTVVYGSAGKRRRSDGDRNDRNSKRSAVMRVCTTGEGSGSGLGAGGSGNGAGGGEMEYDGRVEGIGASAGKEGGMGRSGQIGGGGKRGVLM
jgi:hypothetical protein